MDDKLGFFGKIINLLFKEKYNCNKGKHYWMYEVPLINDVVNLLYKPTKDEIFCRYCGIKKYK